MKIAFLTPFVPPVIDGVGEYSFHVVRHLRMMGEDARIFTSRKQSKSQDWINPSIDKWDGPSVIEALAGFNPEVCFFQYVPQLYGKYGLCWNALGIPDALKKAFNCHAGVTFHEFAPGWSLSPKVFFLSTAMRLQAYRLANSADIAVTTCEIYRKILKGYAPNLNTMVIPVGANVMPEIIPQKDLEMLKQKYGLIGKKVFSFFGRVSNFKNPKLAVRVLKEVLAQDPAAVLAFIGCGRSSQPDLFAQIMRCAEDLGVASKIVETGDISHKIISAWLQVSDVFLFPQLDGVSSRNTTVMSAMAHGLPIVAYEPIRGNFEGYTVPIGVFVARGDERKFINAALGVSRPAFKEQDKLTQIRYFAENFSWEKIAMKYLEIMKNA